ncbi:DUF4342 domain-containing protein [Candidatus Microgenomates bacterium]|nr:DUF4342 domain-containing protein [Candidatus Microgenomates bacterium]
MPTTKKTSSGNTSSKTNKPPVEEFSVKGEKLLEKVKEIVHEGNVRKIIIKGKNGKSIAEFPLTVGVVGALLLPMFAAVGAIAALVSECTITVERDLE